MSSLPEPVARFVELVSGSGGPQISTLVLETDAWMRRPKLPPIPLAIRMSHRLGEAFVHRIRIGRGPLSIPFGMDAYVDGRGLMKIGPAVEMGPTYRRGRLDRDVGRGAGLPERMARAAGRPMGRRRRPHGAARRRRRPRRGALDGCLRHVGRLSGLVRGRSPQGRRTTGSLDGAVEPLAPHEGRDPRAQLDERAVGGRGPTMAGPSGDIDRAERAGRAGHRGRASGRSPRRRGLRPPRPQRHAVRIGPRRRDLRPCRATRGRSMLVVPAGPAAPGAPTGDGPRRSARPGISRHRRPR